MKSAALAAAIVAVGAGCDGGGRALPGSAGAGGGSVTIVGAGGTRPSTGQAGFPGMNCADVARPMTAFPPDVVIVLDASASMNDAADPSCPGACSSNSKWAAAVAAIHAVVPPATARVNWGLTALPDSARACDGGRIAVLAAPYTAASIEQAIGQRTRGGVLLDGGNSPMRAAVEVATAHLAARAPGGHRVILLITDGEPDCAPGAADVLASDADGTIRAVTEAAKRGIETSVIGVATAGTAAQETLLALAGAGSSANVVTAYATGTNADQLTAALANVVSAAADCTLAIPDPPTNDGTTSRSDIRLESADMTLRIPRDPNRTNGWDYTDDSLMGVQLYGSACDWLRAGNTVYVDFPCHDA